MNTRQAKSPKSSRANTRDLLTEHALNCLIDSGLSTVNFVSVSKAAGMTRGAMHHHFEDMTDLLSSVFDRLFEELEKQTESVIDQAANEAPSIEAVVESLWQVHNSRAFRALVQARLGASEDPRVRKSLQAVLGRRTERILSRLAGIDTSSSTELDTEELALRWKVVLFTLLGMSVSQMTNPKRSTDDPERRRILSLLVSMIDAPRP